MVPEDTELSLSDVGHATERYFLDSMIKLWDIVAHHVVLPNDHVTQQQPKFPVVVLEGTMKDHFQAVQDGYMKLLSGEVGLVVFESVKKPNISNSRNVKSE